VHNTPFESLLVVVYIRLDRRIDAVEFVDVFIELGLS
jgi:hypothetical protein